MHINKSHRTRAAWISVGFAAVLGMGCPVGAEPILGRDGAQRLSGAVGSTPPSGGLEPQDAEASDGESDDPPATLTGATAPPEPRIGERSGRPSVAGQTDSGSSERLLFQTAAQAMASADTSIDEDAQWARELASAVLDAVRPLYEGLVESGMVDMFISLEAELGLSYGQFFGEILFGDYWQNGGLGAQPDSVTWAGPGNRADPFNHPNASAEVAKEERNAAILLSQLIDEIKPWALSLVALYLLGHLVKLALDYSRWKKARRRKRMTMRARRRRRLKRSPAA
jgi:hypothetical protein